MGGCTGECGWMDGWTHGRMDVCTGDECMGGWMSCWIPANADGTFGSGLSLGQKRTPSWSHEDRKPVSEAASPSQGNPLKL